MLDDILFKKHFIKNETKMSKVYSLSIAFVTEDVEGAFRKSLAAGAFEIKKPIEKPWGQIVGYVKDCNGYIIKLCSPMN